MTREELEVYSPATNAAVIRPPGRRFPGMVVQGDTLSLLCDAALDVAARLRQLGVQDEACLSATKDLIDGLVGRILHYQDVLDAHNIELPYAKRYTESDLVRLSPDEC